MIFEEYQEDGIFGAIRLQSELMNPFRINIRDSIENPNIENVIRTAYLPSMGYVSLRGLTWLLGEPMPGFFTRQASRAHDIRQIAKAGVRGIPAAATVSAGVTFVAAGTAVNEFTRRKIGGGYTTPFSSGFGTVVG